MGAQFELDGDVLPVFVDRLVYTALVNPRNASTQFGADLPVDMLEITW